MGKIKIKSIGNSGVYQTVTPGSAGWELLNFEARLMNEGEVWHSNTGENEYAIVILGGKCSVESTAGNWFSVGKRKNVFDGMPYAVYLPRHTEFAVHCESDLLDIACGWCHSDADSFARLITPEDSKTEFRGGENASRQINSIIPPGFECNKIVAVEVFTPGGNWSSYPPHKHDEHKEKEGVLLEADLEEIYFYKFDKPNGYAIQHVYNDSKSLNELCIAENNDIILVPEGYHPVVAAPGYNAYYLNFLAGSAQSLKATDDPAHTWVKTTWQKKDERLPIVKNN
jgi:5-deoxy-glucuronate isomerase